MKRLGVLLVMLFASIMFVGSPASATGDGGDIPEKCYETVDVPGTPAVPAVEEVSHIVHHDAVTETVHHEAVTHTEYHFAKFTQERTKKGNAEWSAYGPWVKYSPETHTSWELNTNPIGSPQFHSSGNDKGTKWERLWQARFDGQTRVITDKKAYDEVVTVSEAYDEKVIDVEYVPAVPEVPATTKQVEVPCPPVDVCPDLEGDQPEGTDCNPVVPPVDVCPDVEGDQPEGTDCNPVVPPVDPPVTDTPPVTDVPDKDISTPVKLVKETPKKDVPVDQVLPNTGAPENLRTGLLVGLFLTLGGFGIIAATRRKQVD